MYINSTHYKLSSSSWCSFTQTLLQHDYFLGCQVGEGWALHTPPFIVTNYNVLNYHKCSLFNEKGLCALLTYNQVLSLHFMIILFSISDTNKLWMYTNVTYQNVICNFVAVNRSMDENEDVELRDIKLLAKQRSCNYGNCL